MCRFQISKQGIYTRYQYKIPLHGDNTFLHRITNATKTEVSRLSQTSFFFKEPVKTLIAEFERKYKNKIYISMFDGCLVFVLYQVYLYLYLSTLATPPNVFTIILFFSSSIWAIIEIIGHSREVVRVRETMKRKRIGKRPYILNTSFALPAVCFWGCVFILCIVDLTGLENNTVQVVLHSLTTFFSCCSFMYFFQMSPTFSHMTVMIEKMIEETIKFMFLIMFMQCGYAMLFYVMFVSSNAKNELGVGNGTVNEQFGFSRTLYEMFLVSFAGKLPDDIYFVDTAVPAFCIVFYILGLLYNAIVFLNLLIAIFSHQVEDVYRLKHDIRIIIRLSMLLHLRNVTIVWQNILAKRRRIHTFNRGADMFIIETVEKSPLHVDEIVYI